MNVRSADDLERLITEAMSLDDWASVAIFADELDALEKPRPVPTLLSSALWYAEQGLKVFPLQPGSKLPYKGSSGFKDATSEFGGVLNWWRHRPSSNIGLATGHLVDVVDVDGPEGVVSWAAMVDDLPRAIGTVSTPRAGGSHLYVAATGRGNRAGIAPGIDYRGLGGYVVAPPSVNADGVRYRWRRPLGLAAAPGISSTSSGQPSGIAGAGLLASGAAAEEGSRCAVCGSTLVVVEAGQTTHPCCGP